MGTEVGPVLSILPTPCGEMVSHAHGSFRDDPTILLWARPLAIENCCGSSGRQNISPSAKSVRHLMEIVQGCHVRLIGSFGSSIGGPPHVFVCVPRPVSTVLSPGMVTEI